MQLPIEVNTLLNTFSIQSLGLNFLDLVILLVFLFYVVEGFSVGFIASFFDLTSFILSFIFGLKFYSLLGQILTESFSIPHGFANAIGFFVVAFLSEIIISLLLRKIYHRLCSLKFDHQANIFLAWLKSANQIFGLLPGALSAFVLLSFFLTVVISLPFSPFLKRAVSNSRLGGLFVSQTQGFEKTLNNIFGGALNETISFLTVEPEGDQIVNLKFKATSVTVDQEAEQQMLVMVNKERKVKGLTAVSFDGKLTAAARNHAKDMFAKGYFSHYTPDGASPFDRLVMANIAYLSAGENLALAPNVVLAMQGLMDSPGHRANILSANFGKVGIGVIDAGIYGEMFAQEFTN